MAQKPHTFQRPLGERRYKKLFVVSVEGSKTEPQYFAIFNQPQSIVLVKCLKRPSTESSPIQVLKKMQGYLRKESLRKTDEVWIVVDKDDWTWVCQQPEPPEFPREKRKNLTPQQKLAWEYNQFLDSNGYSALAKQNEKTIPNDRMMILEFGRPMSIVLNHSLLTLQDDFGKSKDEILKSQRIVRELQGDKLSPVR
jgi:hypothetical protein